MSSLVDENSDKWELANRFVREWVQKSNDIQIKEGFDDRSVIHSVLNAAAMLIVNVIFFNFIPDECDKAFEEIVIAMRKNMDVLKKARERNET